MDEEVRHAVESLIEGRDVDRSTRILFDGYYGKLQRFFRRRGAAHEDGLDLAQITFGKLFKHIGKLREPGRFEVFLWVIARNVLYRWWERQKSRKDREVLAGDVHLGDSARERPMGEGEVLELLLAEGMASDPLPPSLRGMHPAEQLRLRELEERLGGALAKIAETAPRMAACARLRFVDGMTNTEIAADLATTTQAVGYNISKAREKLRELLGDSPDEGADRRANEAREGAARRWR